jgi:hypothetical protein
MKPLLSYVENLPVDKVNQIRSFFLSNASNFLNTNLLVVIDDLERHSPNISVTDILGALLQLRDDRNCQIILIMNEEALKAAGGTELYLANKEKIIDVELTFSPTLDEAVAIGFSGSEGDQTAIECCRKLKTSNIRTIKKVHNHLARFRGIVQACGTTAPPEFDAQVQSTMALAVWAYWEHVISLSDIKQLESGDVWSPHFDKKIDESKRRFYQLLTDYGYSHTDNTDRLVITFVEQGVVDSKELASTISEFTNELARRQRAAKVNEAWQLYRGSLSPNGDAVADALYSSHAAAIEQVEMTALDAAVRILSELGFQERADDLIEKFVNRATSIPAYHSFPFPELVQDKKLIERWKQSSSTVPDTRSISETVASFCGKPKDVRKDIEKLTTFTEEDFYGYFSITQDERLFPYIKALSKIEWQLPDLLEKNALIERNVQCALDRISRESKINAYRLRNLLQ